ncbi:MAG: TIGR02678 family protein [Opitutaceae bacterium]
MSAAGATANAFRRARLDRLREDLDPLVAAEIRTAICALLQQSLLTPDGSQAAAFGLVRRHRDWIGAWFAHHANWSLAVTAEAARLRKVPASVADATRGAADPRHHEPFTRRRYVLLCLALAALERSDRQITLGRLAEAILNALAADPAFAGAGLTWTLETAADRRDFVHAVRLLLALGVLRRVEGDEDRFLRDRGSDVLYNVARPVLALLLAARRSPSLVPAPGFEERLAALVADPDVPDTPDARNRALRTWLARRLLDDPVLYYDELDDEARAYLDRQRGFLQRDITEATGLEPEVRREGIAMTDLDGNCTDVGLPEQGTEGHLTILLAAWLAEQMRTQPGRSVTIDAVRQQTARFIRRHRHHWRREVSEKGAEIWLAESVLETLAGLALVERRADHVVPRPALGRFALRATPELAEAPETEELPAMWFSS